MKKKGKKWIWEMKISKTENFRIVVFKNYLGKMEVFGSVKKLLSEGGRQKAEGFRLSRFI